MDHERPFNARIFRLYLAFIKDKFKWSEDAIHEFLISLDVQPERIQDENNWFDPSFADRFYFEAVRRTGDSELAFHAGQYINRNTFSPIVVSIARSLMEVAALYKITARINSYFTRATDIRVAWVKGSSAEIVCTPKPGFVERAYMCENRMGSLSAAPRVFDLESAEISHPECIHRGGSVCRYVVRWKNARVIPWYWSAPLMTLLSGSAFGLAFGTRTGVAFGLILGFLEAIRSLRLAQRNLQEEIGRQHYQLESASLDIDRKARELEVVGRISQLTHQLLSPLDLAKQLVKLIAEGLKYDRAILLLADQERQVLFPYAYFGADQSLQDLLENSEFNIDPKNSAGFFIRVFNTRQPLLITDVIGRLDLLSKRSQAFARALRSTSFVAVPVTDETENAIGVLAVDYFDPAKRLTIEDQDLLMTLSKHIGLAIHNAKTREMLENSLNTIIDSTRRQAQLKDAFQKFVPAPAVHQILEFKDAQLTDPRQFVRKKRVGLLFLDIFNFSEISHGLPEEQLMQYVNVCMEGFVKCVEDNHGYVDKFTGDGLLAVFETDSEPALATVTAAIQIIHQIPKINVRLHQLKLPEVAIGCGVHLGPVVIGTVGSQSRVNYTVIGEAVNLAARLESHTRQLGPNKICSSASIRQQLDSKFQWKELGEIRLKGFDELVWAYELVVAGVDEQLDSNSILQSTRDQ